MASPRAVKRARRPRPVDAVRAMVASPLMATITSEQARKFLIWDARGDVLHVREAVPGRGSQPRRGPVGPRVAGHRSL
jgi:hypothetical protein